MPTGRWSIEWAGTPRQALKTGNTRREKRLRRITGCAKMRGFLAASAFAAVREPALFIFPSC
jgi:hypothetical protein